MRQHAAACRSVPQCTAACRSMQRMQQHSAGWGSSWDPRGIGGGSVDKIENPHELIHGDPMGLRRGSEGDPSPKCGGYIEDPYDSILGDPMGIRGGSRAKMGDPCGGSIRLYSWGSAGDPQGI